MEQKNLSITDRHRDLAAGLPLTKPEELVGLCDEDLKFLEAVKETRLKLRRPGQFSLAYPREDM